VADAAPGEQLAQRAVLDVGEGVVCHRRLAAIPCVAKWASAQLDEAVHGRGLLGVVSLDLGEVRVVIDDRVRVVVAATLVLGAHPPTRTLRASTGDGVSGAQETSVAADIQVQQIAASTARD
jgi:hypothetical protein